MPWISVSRTPGPLSCPAVNATGTIFDIVTSGLILWLSLLPEDRSATQCSTRHGSPDHFDRRPRGFRFDATMMEWNELTEEENEEVEHE